MTPVVPPHLSVHTANYKFNYHRSRSTFLLRTMARLSKRKQSIREVTKVRGKREAAAAQGQEDTGET